MTAKPLAPLSRLALVADSEQAFLLRAASARLAKRSLDVQYYLWEDDTTGKLLMHRLLEAARRGVKIRMLLDHANQLGRDVKWASLNAHPNIQVRLFNPFRGRYKHFLQWLYHAPRLNHRMHNKAWIVDGERAIVGGRNIADHYFGVNPATNFRDLDVYARGPIVADTRAAFDAYWDSPLAVPIRSYRPRSSRAAEQSWRWLTQWRDQLQSYPFRFRQDPDTFARALARTDAHCVEAPAVLLFDPPDKAAGARQTLLGQQLAVLLARRPRRQVLLEASYFIPGDNFVAALGRLHKRGVGVAVLTNSLATNDVMVAHAAYGRYREALLKAGVALYELRPTARVVRLPRLFKRRSRSSLHTKALVLDHQEVFVGSFNPDPRSLNVNTEMGYYIPSVALARQLAAFVREGMRAENSFQVCQRGSRLAWRAQEAPSGYWYREPAVSWSRRWLAWLCAWLPIEDFL